MMDKLSICVITTKYIVTFNSTIVRVIHDDEGYWQFLGREDNLKDEDAMLVSLEEIIQLDSSLKAIINIPRSKMAIRENQSSPWVISDFKYEE